MKHATISIGLSILNIVKIVVVFFLSHPHLCVISQVVVFQPPRLQTKLEESRVVYDGPATSGKIQDFVKSKQ